MAPLVTHLVIGERVFSLVSLPCQDNSAAYGAFLLGCVPVDVHGFGESEGDRRITHFVGRLQEDGESAFLSSCDRFLEQLDTLLTRSMGDLDEAELAFVAGYLCHLAADEMWKEMGWRMMKELGLESLADLSVPGDVFMTVFDVLSCEAFADFAAVAAALERSAIPDVLTHVPWTELRRVWDLVEPHVMDRGSEESYFAMLERAGSDSGELARTRRRHERSWGDAVAFLGSIGGVTPYIEAAVARSLAVLSRLWPEESVDGFR